jgi:anti-sigma regulatory factor (Ser/Thr protein kinase)
VEEGLIGLQLPLAETLQIRDKTDCAMAQTAARQAAERIGFPEVPAEEIALVAAELASNLMRHAGKGTFTLTPLGAGDYQGLQLESVDEGPGISDVGLAFADRYSTAGSLGYGLGTVNRLMDEVDVSSAPGSGTRIVCRRWKARTTEHLSEPDWEVGAATRSRRHARANGDAVVMCKSGGKLLAGVIDGLGHGEPAMQAAMAARQYVKSHSGQPLASIFAGTSLACGATRGVVMALARFDSPLKLSFATVGNIACRAWCGSEKMQFLVQRGILCRSDPKVVVHEIAWRPEWLLVMHSDGVRDQWHWQDLPAIQHDSAPAVARRILSSFATDEDDASVMAVRHKRG